MWERHRLGAAQPADAAETAHELLFAAVLAAPADAGEAARLAERAATWAPESLLAQELVSAFRCTDPLNDVYRGPEAFQLFIDHGTNPALYRATVSALASLHAKRAPRSVLDLGAGDGRVTAEVLDRAGQETSRLDLVEPSAALADQAAERLDSRNPNMHVCTAQSFAQTSNGRWDLAQATFSMHTIPPRERAEVLESLAQTASSLAIVEFDVPDLRDEPARFAHCAERFEVGLAEYMEHPSVAAGFLIPLFLGWFTPGERTSWEVSIAAWTDELERAGFAVATQPVMGYWWAPAFLAVGTRG